MSPGSTAAGSIAPGAHRADVRYEIRSALTRRTRDLQAAGLDIIKLNIGGALYAFSQVRASRIASFDDNAFALRLLEEESVLVMPGSSFNAAASRHIRLTLPPPAQLREVFVRIEQVLLKMADELPRSKQAWFARA